ncbi:MAG: pyruvate dehydrogenase complex dihydrolipoamide acetyltransferase [Planctomycetes bacterium]|nr:pyruvate dehydrogenase complex dihydrolipoamide acetyltransferase [Planctomycetota bacterium]
MIVEQKMPALSPTMTEGTIISWRIKPGDQVKSGQVMAEIQTDKAVGEWECLDGGTVADILIPAGTMTKVNAIAAVFTTKPGEDAKAAIEKAKKSNAALMANGGAAAAAPTATATPAPSTPAAAPPASAPTPSQGSGTNPGSHPGKGARVSPVASRMAAANSLDLSRIRGSGPDGRIIRRDIEKALADGSARIGSGGAAKESKPKLNPFRADAQPVTEVPLSTMRAAIGRRLLEAKTQIPHFYVTERIDCANLVALRDQLGTIEGVKVTYNDLVVRAAALALRMHPKVNATWHGASIRLHDSADISIAVAIPDGLITPILFKAHTLTVRQISEAVRELAKKAQAGKLKPAEFEGGTFTISNLGMFGIESFSAIINPPQAAILAVGGIKDEPIVRDGAVVAGKTMRLTLSADHRAVDGAIGAAFMKSVRELLEAPAALLI